MLNVRERRKLDAWTEVEALVDALGGVYFAMDFLGVTRDTVERWLKRETVPSQAVRIALRAANGRPPFMERDKRWQGWRFGADGLLYAPGYSNGFSAGLILARQFEIQQIKALEDALAQAQAKLKIAHDALDAIRPAANERAYFG